MGMVVEELRVKIVAPELGANAFNCPHCGAFADQKWAMVFVGWLHGDQKPLKVTQQVCDEIESSTQEGGEEIVNLFRNLLPGRPIIEPIRGTSADHCMYNVYVSRCSSCKNMSIWTTDKIAYPDVNFTVPPNPDMPDDVKQDYIEAAAIVHKSPRGAAALLRLCVEKLVNLLEPKKTINDGIAALVRKGLPVQVQQALDVVRVIGNNAVHPGHIDLNDDHSTSIKLFTLINIIVDSMIVKPNEISSMFGALPENSRQQIAKRDQKSKSQAP